jgi:IclR family transcriptional regulator, KDG regulon repressor
MNNTLIKGLGLLEVLARADRPLGVTELANRLGIGKSNVHRLLQALVELGYARRDEDNGSYAASIRIWELGSALLANLDLPRVAQSWMQWLLERHRETVHLSVLDGDEVVYVHKLDSPEPVRAYTQVGGRAPAHCVATGKAMLAWVGEPQLNALSMRLRGHTPTTITGADDFLREMDRIRQMGYAINRGEWRDSVGGLAAPIRDPGGRVIAAVGISGPIDRLKLSGHAALTADLLQAAAGVAASLAGDATAPTAGTAAMATMATTADAAKGGLRPRQVA